MQTQIESAVIPSLTLKVDGKEYVIEYPLSSVVKAEKKTGLNLKSVHTWITLPAEHIQALLEAGLAKNHPEVTAEEVQAICDRLNPEALDETLFALCNVAFPRFMAKVAEQREKGKTSPNG